MLKLTYTEAGLYLEHISAPLEILMAQRVLLSIRAGQRLCIEPGRASFLLPNDAPDLPHLELILSQDGGQVVEILAVDGAFVEVSLQGIWVAEHPDAEDGMFIVTVSDWAETLIYRLWQETRSQVSSPV